jgi:hypothetical protein
MNWLLEGKEVLSVDQFSTGAIGFVYKITNTKTGKFYIGKKSLESKTNKLLTKKEQSEWSKPGRIPKKKLLSGRRFFICYLSGRYLATSTCPSASS